MPVGQSIATGQGSVTSLIELQNGELISTGNDSLGLHGTLRRWRDLEPVGESNPIVINHTFVTSLIELNNGELISTQDDGALRRWALRPVVVTPFRSLVSHRHPFPSHSAGSGDGLAELPPGACIQLNSMN